MPSKPRVHLVGSVPLKDSREVLETCGGILTDLAPRLPDGETGSRIGFVNWQRGVFEQHPAFEKAESISHTHATGISYQNFRLRRSVSAAEVEFDRLGYADAARESYEVFRILKSEGKLRGETRFQVSLPTALDITWGYVVPSQRAAIHDAIQRRLHAEIAEICADIPHRELSIQIDVCHEILILEDAREPLFEDPGEMLPALVRTADQVPNGVDLGFHLCYGDGGHKHTVEPKDMALMVKVINQIAREVCRPVAYFHAPVPRNRDDQAYFAPLADLRIADGTEVYLGLLHYTDGFDGTMRRVAAARSRLRTFGIATECGLGRRPPESIRDLLDIHVRVAEAMAS